MIERTWNVFHVRQVGGAAAGYAGQVKAATIEEARRLCDVHCIGAVVVELDRQPQNV
jgi:hypothetical protein